MPQVDKGQSAKIRRLIDGALERAFDDQQAVAAKKLVGGYIDGLENKILSLECDLASAKAEKKKVEGDCKIRCHNAQQNIESETKKAQKRAEKKVNCMKLAISKLRKGEIAIADGTALKLDGEYYGGDGRKWKIVNLESPNWFRAAGVDASGNPVTVSVNRMWLTVEPPKETDVAGAEKTKA